MPALGFLHPQFLALLALLPLVWRYATAGRWSVATVLRLGLAALAAIILARPRLDRPEPGVDLVVLVDRSASCAADVRAAAREIVPRLDRDGGEHDRVAVVGFAEGAIIERPFATDADAPPEAGRGLDPNASDLDQALRLAVQMRRPTRRTALVVLSDGLYTGASPLEPETLVELGGMPVWHRRYGRPAGPDAAAGEIAVPDLVAPRSAWLVRYTLHANAPMNVGYVLARDGLELARGRVDLEIGDNRFFVRDTADRPGVLEYRLDIDADPDAIPENNHAVAVLRVEGAPRVLFVPAADGAGGEGLLARSLAAAAIPVDLARPSDFPASPALLAPYKLVVLENRRLSELPPDAVGALVEAVESGIGALLVTGGANSFGPGGYHRSRLDPLLPVEMELRDDKRRNLMALAMALDRSGSMGAPVGDGRVKMDLANLGAAEAIRLLGPLDQVSVIAVDSAAHIIVPLSRADRTGELVDATLRIRPMGGGIFCREAMEAAAKELEKSRLPNRALVIFADAADAEQQEGCVDMARELLVRGISTSVIAMGSEHDSDADFLIQLARAGGGEALFSDRIQDLPLLFTQEVARVSQRGFVAEAVVPGWLPAATGLGPPAGAAIGGYNVSFAREGARVLAALDDEFATPVAVWWTKGRAVAGAALFEADGEYAGDFGGRAEAPAFWAAFARRLAGGVRHADARAYTDSHAGLAGATIEFPRETANRLRGRELPAAWLGPGGEAVAARLQWTGPRQARIRTPLRRPGHYLPTFDLGEDGVLTAPAASVSYSAEFAPRDGLAGAALLEDLGRATGGGAAADFDAVRRSAVRRRDGSRDLLVPLLALWLLLFVVEVSGRRLAWFR